MSKRKRSMYLDLLTINIFIWENGKVQNLNLHNQAAII